MNGQNKRALQKREQSAGRYIGYSESAGGYSGFFVGIEDGRRVLIRGYLALLKYEKEVVCLRMRKKRLIIRGNYLTLDCYAGNELCVSGEIDSVSLEGQKR